MTSDSLTTHGSVTSLFAVTFLTLYFLLLFQMESESPSQLPAVQETQAQPGQPVISQQQEVHTGQPGQPIMYQMPPGHGEVVYTFP